MISLLWLIDTVISLYIWVIVIGVVLSWLVHFRVVNTSNPFVYRVGEFVFRITDPALRPIRNVLPNMGGIDISAIVLIIALLFARNLIFEFLA
ncbi:MAG: YggT family protein [Proteobacteria bacterium]|nr:YggT family protein [Pseudomonadota bacterium]